MDKEVLKRRNLKFLWIGIFLISFSIVLIDFFLPYYLKSTGLGILEIGILFTIGLALANLLSGISFGKLQKKIKLKTGLLISSLFNFLYSFLFFIFQNSFGVLASKVSGEIGNTLLSVSRETTEQHNVPKNEHRKVNAYSLSIETSAYIFALILSVILIKQIGFSSSLLVFSILALPPLLFFRQIKDKTRFKPKKPHTKIPKINKKVRLLFFAELIYWFALGASFTLVITFLAIDYFSSSIEWLAILFGGLYLSMTFSTLIFGRILDKKDLIKTSILGMFLLFFSAIIIILSKNIYTVFGAMILEGIGVGIWLPSKNALWWKLIDPRLREQASGYLHGIRNFLRALGPLAGGILVTYFGILSPFYLKAGICLIVIGIYIYFSKTINKS